MTPLGDSEMYTAEGLRGSFMYLEKLLLAAIDQLPREAGFTAEVRIGGRPIGFIAVDNHLKFRLKVKD